MIHDFVVASRPERTLSDPELDEGESKTRSESKEATQQSPTGDVDAYAAAPQTLRAPRNDIWGMR